MDEIQLSWYQALQLAALGPCLFMIFFLCVAGRRFNQIIVPLLYFLCLTCTFLLPLRDIVGLNEHMHTMLLVGAAATPSFCFLLIVQFMTSSLPKAIFWTILAVPLIGGSQLMYATVVTDAEICIYEHLCTTARMFRKLYDIFSISLTCLLSLLIYRRMDTSENTPWEKRRKYAVVLALIFLNLLLLGIDLMQLNDVTDRDHARIAKSFIRIGFIYLVLTSLFRVFDRSVEIDYVSVPSMKPQQPNDRELTLAARIRELLGQEKLYRDMKLSRERLAAKLGVNEGMLSRVVNQCFHENVSMLINQYRVDEAKERLAKESTAITAIAFEVGFSSIPSFNRVFKQLSGMSPSEYRQGNSVAGKPEDARNNA